MGMYCKMKEQSTRLNQKNLFDTQWKFYEVVIHELIR